MIQIKKMNMLSSSNFPLENIINNIPYSVSVVLCSYFGFM